MPERPSILGPYRIVEDLGRGGMGVVYRAKHHETGQMVALKTVHAASQWSVAGLRREILALARVRHPQVVRILDEGVDQGIPWYAMELLTGTTLRQFATALFGGAGDSASSLLAAGPPARAHVESGAMESAPWRWWTESLRHSGLDTASFAPRESPDKGRQNGTRGDGIVAAGQLRAVLTLVRRLCSPLGYLHGEGIVHGDLKLENVLLVDMEEHRGVEPASSRLERSECQPASRLLPVLLDFGLISEFGGTVGREALELSGSASGSIGTMAPEQLLGETVDARADLYALGCILYELLTGRPPFVGPLPAAIVYGHLREAPRPPSQLVSGVPAGLDELVLRLLAKAARERLGHVGDVAAFMDQLGAEPSLVPDEPKHRTYLYRSSLTGRDAPLGFLREALARCQDGVGQLTLLAGESGIGKTRLMMEFCREAAASGAMVLAGECSPSARPALEAMRKPLQSIADHCRESGVRTSELIFGPRGRVLCHYEPTISALPGQATHPEPAELPSEAAQMRVYRYLAETLRTLSLTRPVVLVQDDVHWAGDLELGFLEYLVRGFQLGTAPGMRLLVLAAFRTEEVTARLERFLTKVAGADAVSKLQLERIDASAVSSMVGEMLALRPPPKQFSRVVAQHSEGNPFFVAEYLRAGVDQGLLRRGPSGTWLMDDESSSERPDSAILAAPPLPRAIRDLVGRRLDGLPPSARRVAEAAAVVGRGLDVALVRDATALSESVLLEALAELLRRQVLERIGSRLHFAHDKIREVAYERIDPARRVQLHDAVARVLEGPFDRADPQEMPEARLAALGHHWEGAGDGIKASRYYFEAARMARSRLAFDEAEAHYRASIRLNDEPEPRTVAAHNELGEEVLSFLGRAGEAIPHHELALAITRSLRDPAAEGDTLRRLARSLEEVGRVDEARAHLERAIELHQGSNDLASECADLGGLARLHQNQGLLDEARQVYERILRIRRNGLDARAQIDTVNGLANIAVLQGRLAEARNLYDGALDMARREGDRHREGRTLASLGILHFDEGRLQAAEGAYLDSLAILREVGSRGPEASVLGNLGLLCKGSYRLAEAQELNEQALAINREMGRVRGEAAVLGNLAELAYERGQLREAQQLCERALILHRQIGNRLFEGITLDHLGLVIQATGQLTAARELLEAALRLHRDVGYRRGEGLVLCHLAELDLVQGAVEDAERRLQQSLTIHQETGDERSQAVAALHQARLLRRSGGPEPHCLELLDSAEAKFAKTLGVAETIDALCERGHLELAQMRPAAEHVLDAERRARQLEVAPESRLGQTMSRLRHAQEARETGEALFRGERLQEIPEGLKRWLTSTGQLIG